MTCSLRVLVAMGLILSARAQIQAADFRADFSHTHDRVWVGPELWANPMEDWHVVNGRLECISPGPNRNIHALTQQLSHKPGVFDISVRLGRLDLPLPKGGQGGGAKGSAGFRIGIQDEIDDYRARLIYGSGWNIGVNTDGDLFLEAQAVRKGVVPQDLLTKGVELKLSGRPAAANKYLLTLTARDPASGKTLGSVSADDVSQDEMAGNIALVNNHFGQPKKGKKAPEPVGARFWFNDWQIAGSKIETQGKPFGPVLWAMHTLSRRVLKMTAQMPPIGAKEEQTVRLQIQANKEWQTVGEAKIDADARTATFRVPKWNDRQSIPYRLVYTMVGKDGSKKDYDYTGTVRPDPVDKETIVVAGLSCNADYCFPNREIFRNLTIQDPDVLFFAGDQIYEYVGGYPLVRTPTDRAILNYLRKWQLFGLAFGDLMRDRPTLCIPDDHDVYQGNIWGNGGNPVSLADHARGGYVQHRDFVEVVHKTQCSNLPDPFDPTPIKQNISVYYCDMVYGRIGFAVVADRMFKSGPEGAVATWPGRPDHLTDPKIDVAALDKPGLNFLGERQEKFLRHWAADWKGVDMKCVLSQTIFCNLANYHGGAETYLIADLDSGGWPQAGRGRALREMRRGFALHLAGDQHLASVVHHGIDGQGDANFSFCVPATANFYPRRWQPDKEGLPVKNRPKLGLPNTGDYLDGLKNHVRVYAVANPEDKYRQGRLANLHDKASGYGIVRFHKKTQTITMECWKLLFDAANPKEADQFPGWPMTISMLDNYGRKPKGHLPMVLVAGLQDPVIQVIDETAKDVVYTLRIKGDRFRPMVFGPGPYTVKVSDSETNRLQTLQGVQPTEDAKAVLKVDFPQK